MGSRMAAKLIAEGHEVTVWNRSQGPMRELELRFKRRPGEGNKINKAYRAFGSFKIRNPRPIRGIS